MITVHECDEYINKEKTQLKSPVRTCDFETLSGEYAWVDEMKQQYDDGAGLTPDQSALNGKRTHAYCREVSSFN